MFHIQCSQAHQDVFVSSILGREGTYIEIGGHDPKKLSNTYNLEVNLGWTGFSVEIDRRFEKYWNACKERNNKIIYENALSLDYVQTSIKFGLSKNIDYLSCDIEPPENTFNALKRVINQGFSFEIITFETDRYSAGDEYEKKANLFLLDNDYKLAVYDVYFINKKKKICYFENWYIKNSIPYEAMSYEQWLTENKNLIKKCYEI
jgi:hypothetical protein